MTNIRRFALVAPFALAACSDGHIPTGPIREAAPSRPSASISDAVHGGGTAGVYFLAPVVAQPKFSGTFDATRQVSVLVCPLGGSSTVAPAASCTGGTPLDVAVNATGNFYHTNWKLDHGRFPAGTYYRLRVVEAANGGTELAHLDVYVGKEPKNFDQSAYVALAQSSTVPIKFRIEKGAATGVVPGDSTGGGDTPPPLCSGCVEF